MVTMTQPTPAMSWYYLVHRALKMLSSQDWYVQVGVGSVGHNESF
jgi:hypothetical protein